MLYVPEGFGHGFQTLADDTEVLYQVSELYAPGAEGGFRWDDPGLRHRVAVGRTRGDLREGCELARLRPSRDRRGGARVIIVDRTLERREAEGRPVRVGLIGTGFMGSGIVRQMLANQGGMRLVATANRTLEKADRAYRDAGARLDRVRRQPRRPRGRDRGRASRLHRRRDAALRGRRHRRADRGHRRRRVRRGHRAAGARSSTASTSC